MMRQWWRTATDLHISPRAERLVVAIASVVALGLSLVVVLQVTGPSIWGDESLYVANSRAIFSFDRYYFTHYPPFYSLILAPGFFFSNPSGYFLALNSLLAASVVPLSWLLARAIGIRHAWWAAILAALLPLHIAHVQFVMSENVGTPLTLVCMILAVRGRRSEAAYFGLALAALHLSRYFFGPAIPLFLLIWVIRTRRESGSFQIKSLLLALGLYLGAWALWVWYGLASGSHFFNLVGGTVLRRTQSRGLDGERLDRLIGWATVYGSYLLLTAVFVWVLLAVWAAHGGIGNLRRWRERFRGGADAAVAFSCGLALLVIGTYAIVVRHSWNAPYNQAAMDHTMSRYLYHLTPLLLVLGLLVLERLALRSLQPLRVIVAVAAVMIGFWLGWAVLFRRLFWNLRPSSNATVTSSADVMGMQHLAPALVVSILAIIGALLLLSRRIVMVRLAWTLLATVVLIGSFVRVSDHLDERPSAVNALTLSAQRWADETSGPVVVWLDRSYSARYSAVHQRWAMDYWGPRATVTFQKLPGISSADLADCLRRPTDGKAGSWFYVTRTPPTGVADVGVEEAVPVTFGLLGSGEWSYGTMRVYRVASGCWSL